MEEGRKRVLAIVVGILSLTRVPGTSGKQNRRRGHFALYGVELRRHETRKRRARSERTSGGSKCSQRGPRAYVYDGRKVPGAFQLRFVSNDDLLHDLEEQGAIQTFLDDGDQLYAEFRERFQGPSTSERSN